MEATAVRPMTLRKALAHTARTVLAEEIAKGPCSISPAGVTFAIRARRIEVLSQVVYAETGVSLDFEGTIELAKSVLGYSASRPWIDAY